MEHPFLALVLSGWFAAANPLHAEEANRHAKRTAGADTAHALLEESYRGPLAPRATLESFESYTLGQLVPQGGWFNISDTNDRVVNGPFAGQAGRHFATGANSGSLQILSWDFPTASYYGDFSLDMVISGGGTTYAVGICDDFVAGSCFYHTNLTFALSGTVFSSNDLTGTATWTTGTPVRVGWRVAADRSVISFLNGRAFSVGESEAAISRGVMNPIAVVISRSANEGTGTANGDGDTLTIDNLNDDNASFIDPPGLADLLHGASLGPYAQTMPRRRWGSWIATTGEAFPWYLFAYNAAPQSSQTAFVANLPAHLTPASSCGGSLVGNVFTTSSQSIGPNGIGSCELNLTPTQVGDFPVSSTIAPTTPDPFAANDDWSGTVRVRNPLPGQRCRTSGGTGCPSNIGESAGSNTISSMTVSGCPVASDVNVGIAINHTYSGDVSITLQPPSGPAVTLVDEVCSAGRFFHLQTVLDDDAATLLGATCPAQGRTAARPQSALTSGFAALQTVPGNGVWTLTVTDAYNQDGGVLDDWSLVLNCGDDLFEDGFE